MLRFVGLILVLVSVGLAIFDTVIQFRGGGPLTFTSVEGLWNLFGGQWLLELRSSLRSLPGSLGDWFVDLPAAAVLFVLGLLLVWIAQRMARRAEEN